MYRCHVNARCAANPKLNLSAFYDENGSKKPCKLFLCDYIFLVTKRNKWMTSDKMGTSFLRLAFQYNVLLLLVQNEIYIFENKTK